MTDSTDPSPTAATRACPNCGTPAPDRYCPRCGQEQFERLVSTRRWIAFALTVALVIVVAVVSA